MSSNILKIVFISIVFISLSATSAFAQTNNAGINLTLSPVFVNLATDPGEEVGASFKVTNNSNARERLKLQVARFDAGPGGNTMVLVDTTPNDEFIKWVSFSEDQFNLEANQTKTIRVSIKPSTTASLGYYYAIIVNRVQENTDKNTTTVTGAPALPILLEIRTPNAKRELQLIDFSTDKLIYENLPVNFTVRVKNPGNIHLVPYGDIFVDWGNQKDVGVIAANPGRGNILPQTTRNFDSTWEDGFIVRGVKQDEKGNIMKDENGTEVYETQWNWSKADKFRIGQYTAHALFVYDNGERDIPLEATVTFWVIPWKILGVVTLIAIFFLVGIKNTLASFFKKRK